VTSDSPSSANPDLAGPLLPRRATASRIQRRVTAYVLRDHKGGRQLLVLDHLGLPAAGVQVPATECREGELEPDVVAREVTARTGLVGVRPVSMLGTLESTHPLTGRRRITSYWSVAVPSGCEDQWEHTVRARDDDDGMRLRCRFVGLPLSDDLPDGLGALLDHLLPPGTPTS